MEKPKSLTDRIKLIKLQSSLNTVQNMKTANNENGNSAEEYPKLRRPKPETLLKIKAHQREFDISSSKSVPSEENKKKLGGASRLDILKNSGQLEEATTGRVDMFSLDSVEKHPLPLRKDFDVQLNKEMESKTLSKTHTNPNKKNSIRSLNFSEQLLVNIFYTKVSAHPNGFFAEYLPDWYKKTFDKDVPMSWLELLEASKRFHIEEVQNKILLYTKDANDDPIKNLDVNASFGNGPKELAFEKNELEICVEPPLDFVRYKHLHKSIKDIAKNVDPNPNKSSGKQIKPNKFYKKSLGTKLQAPI